MNVPARTLLWRGARRRCPRCGGKGLFTAWFRMKDRCPACGYRFEREEGFFTGVYLVNYSVVAVVIVFELFVFLLYVNAQEGDASLLPALAMGIVTAVVLPLLTYPFAKTLWAAIDLVAQTARPRRGGRSGAARSPRGRD